MFNACVLIDIDPIFKIFKNLEDRSSGFFGKPRFRCFQMLDFQNFETSQNNISPEGFGMLFELFWVIWCLQS